MALPNTTPTPNKLYNGEMNKMTDTELRVVLIVTRATLGWIANKQTGMRKKEDWISHTQLIKKSGRSSRAISMAVNSCVQQNWIETRTEDGKLLKTPQERKSYGKRIYYRLGEIFLDKLTIETNAMVDEPSQITTQTIANNDTKPSQPLRTTKESITKEILQKREPTPSQKMLLFLKDESEFNRIAKLEAEKRKLPLNVTIKALRDFQDFWSELNSSGKKQRWQFNKTFELNRRIATWFRRAEEYGEIQIPKKIKDYSDKKAQ